MDKKLSDEQIDRIAKNLLEDFALSDQLLDEIADAPQLWWNVRNQIEAEKARRDNVRFRWFRAPVPAFGAMTVLICSALAFVFLSSANNSGSTAVLETPPENHVQQIAETPENLPPVSPKVDIENNEVTKTRTPENNSLKNAAPQTRFVAKIGVRENSAKSTSRPSKQETLAKAAVEETKTDFIALSYAANTESGQIVRVKVPSSMMVTLGVKTEVENAAELVSAEVVIGDDGLARAIRFIR